jgi:rubrerythrin
MYPTFKAQAEQEGNDFAANEIEHQIQESKEHAEHFMEIMKKAEKRFSALAKVEERHAKAYEDMLNSLEFKEALLGGK